MVAYWPTAFLGGFLKTLRKFVNTLELGTVQLASKSTNMGFVRHQKKPSPLSASKVEFTLSSTQEPYKNGVEAYATAAEGVLSSAGLMGLLMRGPIAVTLAVSAGDWVSSAGVSASPPHAPARHATLSPARRRSRRTSPSPESIFLSRAGDAPRLGERNL